MSLLDHLAAFFDTVWSFVVTLVRSLVALFSFSRRAPDLLRVDAPNDALVKAHSHLRPILLTPKSVTRSPTYYAQRARAPSATSTLSPTATASGSAPQPTNPQRTSPKLDPNDPELGLYVAAVTATDAEPPGTSASSFPGGTPDTSLPTTSLSVVPLTPPDRCYIAPVPSTDCPYAEPWPTKVVLDRGKPKLPGSPLRVSINTDLAFPEPMVHPIGSPAPGRWSPVQIWTSTPFKNDGSVRHQSLSPFDRLSPSVLVPLPARTSISHALAARSRCSVRPYDVSTSNTSSDANTSLSFSYPPTAEPLWQPSPVHNPYQKHAQIRRLDRQSYPRFHYPDAYTYAWTWRRSARVPGKSGPAARTHARSYSHSDLPTHRERHWYDTDAYLHSPMSTLSPPLERVTGKGRGEDEDNLPLGRVKARLREGEEEDLPLLRLKARLRHNRSASVGATLGLGVPIGAGLGLGTRNARTALTPRMRRMSDSCLRAISESTPTPVGVGPRAGRRALDGEGYVPKDWLELLSLRFAESPGVLDTLVPCSERPGVALRAEAGG